MESVQSTSRSLETFVLCLQNPVIIRNNVSYSDLARFTSSKYLFSSSSSSMMFSSSRSCSISIIAMICAELGTTPSEAPFSICEYCAIRVCSSSLEINFDTPDRNKNYWCTYGSN